MPKEQTPIIDSFDGNNSFLSNFYNSPIVGADDNIVYPTVEHYFQAHKVMDLADRQRIANARTPGMAKRAGRAVDLRPDWEKVKVGIMEEALTLKFHIPELKNQLLATGNARLIEGNTWHDNFWGNCNCPKCKMTIGENRLGVLLQKVRNKVKKED